MLFLKSFKAAIYRMNIYGVFPAQTEISVHLAGLDICFDYIKQSQPELKISSNHKRRHITFNLLVSHLFLTKQRRIL